MQYALDQNNGEDEECFDSSNRRIMCRGTIVTSSHTVGRRGALQNAGVCEQCPEMGHELPAGGELLGVDLGIA